MTPATPSLDTIHQIRDTCLCFASQRAARLLARRFDRVFQPLGLTNGQFSMMVALSGQWAPRLGELADFLAMDQATVTAAVKTLERRGWLTLTPDDNDARIRRPGLTDTGRDLVARAVPLWVAEHARMDQDLPGQDATALAQMLAQLG